MFQNRSAMKAGVKMTWNFVLNFERPFYVPQDRSEATPTQSEIDHYAYNLHMRKDEVL
jgi:hypothetical protein